MILALPNLPPVVAEHAAAAVACSATEPPALLVADMSEPNRAPRLWAFDLSDPKHPVLVLQSQVAHGYGSDPGRTGVATKFSDVEGSRMISLGLYRVAAPYLGKHGPSYRLQGLSASNAQEWQRDIMLHHGPYVTPTHVGPSGGCATVAFDTLNTLRLALVSHIEADQGAHVFRTADTSVGDNNTVFFFGPCAGSQI